MNVGEKYGLSKTEADKLLVDFTAFDTDGNQMITREEIKKLMAYEGIPEDTIEEIVVSMMKEIDINKDGLIDFEEFCRQYVKTKKKM
jgi:calmodulin